MSTIFMTVTLIGFHEKLEISTLNYAHSNEHIIIC